MLPRFVKWEILLSGQERKFTGTQTQTNSPMAMQINILLHNITMVIAFQRFNFFMLPAFVFHGIVPCVTVVHEPTIQPLNLSTIQPFNHSTIQQLIQLTNERTIKKTS